METLKMVYNFNLLVLTHLYLLIAYVKVLLDKLTTKFSSLNWNRLLVRIFDDLAQRLERSSSPNLVHERGSSSIV